MAKVTIVVYVDGGVMHTVKSSEPDTEVILVDGDNIKDGDEEPEVPEGLTEVY